LDSNQGNFETSFEQLWIEKYGKQDFGSRSIWQSTLTVLLDPAIATVIVLYILKVGINIFCEYIKPDSV
jgi:hypothetical protein